MGAASEVKLVLVLHDSDMLVPGKFHVSQRLSHKLFKHLKDGELYNNSERSLAASYCYKALHLRYLRGSWPCLQEQWFKDFGTQRLLRWNHLLLSHLTLS